MGHQRGAPSALALRLPGVRLEVLEAVVLLGDAQPAAADSQGGGEVRRHIANTLTYYQHPITNAMSEGAQQPDSEDQEHGLRVPQHRELQDGDPLSLRRARSEPMLNPEAPKF